MRNDFNRITLFVLMVVGLIFCVSPSVVYAGDHKDALIRQDVTVVERGQVIKDVVVLGHNVTVSGDIPEILVVIDGDIYLQSKSVTGIVVSLGGTIHQEPGAQVNAMYHMSLHTPFWTGALFGVTAALLVWVLALAVSMCLAILSVLICFTFRHQIKTPLGYVENSVRHVGMTGVFASLIAFTVSAIFAVTIVGLPLTVFILALYGVAGVVGLAVVSLWIGKLAVRNSSVSRPVWMLSLIGACLMIAVTSIPIVGFLLFCIFWLVGIGIATDWLVFIWRNRSRRRKAI